MRLPMHGRGRLRGDEPGRYFRRRRCAPAPRARFEHPGAALRCALAARRALAWALCVGLGAVQAQGFVSGSVGAVSDYRWRGYSLSDRRPAVQATAVFDHPSGGYAGLFLSSVRFGAEAKAGVQAIGYAGFAERLANGLSWDAGAAYSAFSSPSGYDFADFHVGLAHVDWSVRLSYAPRYFGRPYSATYAELNLTPGSEHALVPLLHVGLLRSSVPPYLGPQQVWDGRIGVAYSIDLFTVELSWGTASRARTTASGDYDRSAWVLRVTRWL
jgi:uncharacterized protein (TIGR02001 family)